MKKLPTLFKRKFENNRIVSIENVVTPGMEWILDGQGTATEKLDGSCCAIINGKFYRRYDAKNGRVPPDGSIPCCDPDPITGHWPHWALVDFEDSSVKWYVQAYKESNGQDLKDGTYEVIGPHFQSNPYHLEKDILERHGIRVLKDVPRTFEGIQNYLESHYIEGIVFWKDDMPMCKIKRRDFGFGWNTHKLV